MGYEILCGIEIEAEHNLPIVPADYHSSDYGEDEDNHNEPCFFGNYFICENDGSISTDIFSSTAEFISEPFLIKNYRSVLEDFKNACGSAELSDVLNFNDSTGAHLHFSVLKESDKNYYVDFRGSEIVFENYENVRINNVVSLNLFRSISRKLKRRIHKKLPLIYPEFIVQYDRKYAKMLNPKKWKNQSRFREVEFNLTNGVTIEFRSFNLKGVKSWVDFFKIYKILFDTIKEVVFDELKKERPFCEESSVCVPLSCETERALSFEAKTISDYNESVYDSEGLKCVTLIY